MTEEIWTCYVTSPLIKKQTKTYISQSSKIDHVYAASHYLSQVAEANNIASLEGDWEIRVFGRDCWKYVHIRVTAKRKEYGSDRVVYEREIVKVEEPETEDIF